MLPAMIPSAPILRPHPDALEQGWQSPRSRLAPPPKDMPDHGPGWALVRDFNAPSNTDPKRARELLAELFPNGETPSVWAPIHLEYGTNTHFGPDCYMNFNCTILDIGARTLFGPGCQPITVDSLVAGVLATVKRNI